MRVRVIARSHITAWKINIPNRPSDQPTHRRWRQDAQTRCDASTVAVIVIVVVVVTVVVIIVASFLLVYPSPSRRLFQRRPSWPERSVGRLARERTGAGRSRNGNVSIEDDRPRKGITRNEAFTDQATTSNEEREIFSTASPKETRRETLNESKY